MVHLEGNLSAEVWRHLVEDVALVEDRLTREKGGEGGRRRETTGDGVRGRKQTCRRRGGGGG